jgi:hypothetical protein
MRTIIAVIALLSYAALAEAQSAPQGSAACKANQNGRLLLTTAEYSNGYKVEAPWRVLATHERSSNSRVTATLSYIVETDPETGRKRRTPLPGTIEMTFRGESNGVMLQQAADVWCDTVSRALAARSTEAPSRVARGGVIM